MNGTLSLALIVKNEEKVLARCLDSAKDIVDEIIIVDTGSTDSTVEIARRYTDKVYSFKWCDDFSAARNFSFEKCTRDFILWLDADDQIKPEDAQKIKALDLSNKEIIISPYHYSHDEYGNTTSVVPRERIIKRSLGCQWREPIHEYILVSGNYYQADFAVHHYRIHVSSERNIHILERVVKKFLESKGAEGNENPDSITRNLYYLGREYSDFGKPDQALECFEYFVGRPGAFWEDVYHAWDKMAEIYFDKNDEGNLRRCVFEGLKVEERRAEPCYYMGQFYLIKNQLDRALYWFHTCLNIKRPSSLLASHRPEYYTWLPCLQLCVTYSRLGDWKKAAEYNERVIQYRPTDSRALFNRQFLSDRMKDKVRDGEGKKLNLGCGNKPIPGFVNVDIFKGPIVDEVFEMTDIPYKDNTIAAISTEHALEHLPFDKVRPTVAEWFRALKPGGELLLKIPDLEWCCQEYINAPLHHPDYFKNKQWFKWTIYGIQKSQAGEPDDAQFHKSGFSKGEISIILEDTGFVIDTLENYMGWGTPSLSVRALKPVCSTRIGWVAQESWEAAQTRIRIMNVNKWLRSQGFKSYIVPDYSDIINGKYDVAIVGKDFSEHSFNAIRDLKNQNKKVVCDVCEDLFQFGWFKEILQIVDQVVCCSYALEEKIRPVNSNTFVIEDAWEPC